MRHTFLKKSLLIAMAMLPFVTVLARQGTIAEFSFDETPTSGTYEFIGSNINYEDGIKGKALSLRSNHEYQSLDLSGLSLDNTRDFTVQFWVKTSSDKPTVLLSQKEFGNKGITTQKNSGWALYTSGGTFAWSIGSGERRVNYERDNGGQLPINDGVWHQITMTYEKATSELWIYYDGQNKAIYNVGFDFSNNEPIRIGATGNAFDYDNEHLDEIVKGAEYLQEYVDAFNKIGTETLKNDELLDLITNPQGLLKSKLEKEGKTYNQGDLSSALEVRKKLDPSPYTVFQNKNLTALKPVNQIYRLVSGKIRINEAAAKNFTQKEKLYPSDFSMDQLTIWSKSMSAEEVLAGYKEYRPKAKPFKMTKRQKDLTVGVWNIWHGGIHWSLEKDGWDSRKRIAEMIREKGIDVILMQETYSGGDFIAAELGYYFATTSDWDYKYQGSNISVISRYPIRDIQVSEETEFNNVAVKLSISKTQEIWAMSNWYGMNNFPKVYDFHKARFARADEIPILFGGDFNAVPHTDGGKSPASQKLLVTGFTDAFRSLYPEVEKYPGLTHQSGSRIDQLYYKGKGLTNTSTEVISSWPSGFPSDHYLIVSKFKLKY